MAKVLIVEDEKTLSDAYSMILEQAGHEIRVAHDGTEAITATEAEEPELILLDLRMPNMNGVEFLRTYDLKNKHPDVRVIVFSNYDMQDEIDEAYNLGADRYVLKAWASPKELLQLVDNALTHPKE